MIQWHVSSILHGFMWYCVMELFGFWYPWKLQYYMDNHATGSADNKDSGLETTKFFLNCLCLLLGRLDSKRFESTMSEIGMKISRILVPQVPHFPFPQNIDYPPWCFYRSSSYKTAQFSSIQYYTGLIALQWIFPLGLRSLVFPIAYDTWSLYPFHTLLGSYDWHLLPSLITLYERSQILKMWDMWNWMLSNFYLYFRINLSFAKLLHSFMLYHLYLIYGVVYQVLKARE
jgi:hypothetical protein